MILTVLAGQDMVCGAAMCSTTVYNGRQSGRILSKAPLWDTAEFVNHLCVYTRKKKKTTQRDGGVLSWTVNSLLQHYLDFLILITSARKGCWKWEQIILQKEEKKVTFINLQVIQLLVFSLQIKNTCQADFQDSMWWICSKIMMNIKKTLLDLIQLYIWGVEEKKKRHQN